MGILKKKYLRQCVVLCSLLLIIAEAGAQKIENKSVAIPSVGIKTNLLYDANGTINLGIEFRTGRKTSLDISGNWNPFSYSDNRKWKHVLVQPEFRLWTQETFFGHFFGLHAHYAFYNVGSLPNPPFSEFMAAHRFQGWLTGAGLSYGYRWNFNSHWALEATVGVGYAYMDHDKYDCENCGKKSGSETKNYFGPTKAGITLVYTFGSKKKQAPQPVPQYTPVVVSEPKSVIQIEAEPEPVPVVGIKSEMELLTEKYPFLFPASAYDPVNPVKSHNDNDNSLTLYYRFNSSTLDKTFAGNENTLSDLLNAVARINKSGEGRINRIDIAGFASPEGTASRNEELAGERAASVRDYILANTDIDKGAISLYNGSADWQGLRCLVAEDVNVPFQRETLEIIDNRPVWDSRSQKGRQTFLRKLGNGRTWDYIKTNLFPKLRNGTFIRVYWEPYGHNK